MKRMNGMTVQSTIGKQIREVLATSLRRTPSSIKPEHLLRDDLGLDSLMTFELLYDLEKAFDLEIPNDDLPGLQTLKDVVKYVEAHVNLSKVNPEPPKTILAKKPPKASSKPSTAKLISGSPAKTKVSPTSPKSRKAANPPKLRVAGSTAKLRANKVSAKKLPGTSKPKTKKK